MDPLVHVAIDKSRLHRVTNCGLDTLKCLVQLLDVLAVHTKHPGLMAEKSIDSIGFYIDKNNADDCRERLVSGRGLKVTYSIRKFDVLFCEDAEKLPSIRRRQCVAVRGTNEMARRLEPGERGIAEIVVTFPSGGTLAVRKHRNAQRLVVMLTSLQKTKKALDAVLPPSEESKLTDLFEKASMGEKQQMFGPSTVSRFVNFPNGAFWVLPSWYAEAVAVIAQDVFRIHALISSTSSNVSRALFIDRVTAHRMESGTLDTHRTLVKGILHRASGGCACSLHRENPPTSRFQRLEFRMEYCGGCIVDGKCNRHWNADKDLLQSSRFPGVCMMGLKVELRCAHEFSTSTRSGVKIELNVSDERMDIAFAKDFILDIAACGSRLMSVGDEDKELIVDMGNTLDELTDERLRNGHIGDTLLQRDVTAVHLLRKGTSVLKTNKFNGRVRADCNAILKTHRHLFRVKE